jgi:hypothetical protein
MLTVSVSVMHIDDVQITRHHEVPYVTSLLGKFLLLR